MFPSTIQHLGEEDLDIDRSKLKKFHLWLAPQGATLQQVMPLAMRNLAIAQQRDRDRICHVRGGGYNIPKGKFVLGEFVVLKKGKENTLQPFVRPHILRI